MADEKEKQIPGVLKGEAAAKIREQQAEEIKADEEKRAERAKIDADIRKSEEIQEPPVPEPDPNFEEPDVDKQ